MNEALGLYDPIFIIPLLQAGFIIFAIISGGIYFGEFSRFEPGHWLFFCFGIFFVCVGLPLLSPKDPSSSKPPDIRRIQPLTSVPEGEPKTPTLDLAALESGRHGGRRPLDGSPKAAVVPRRPAVVRPSPGALGPLRPPRLGHVAAAPVARRRHVRRVVRRQPREPARRDGQGEQPAVARRRLAAEPGRGAAARRGRREEGPEHGDDLGT